MKGSTPSMRALLPAKLGRARFSVVLHQDPILGHGSPSTGGLLYAEYIQTDHVMLAPALDFVDMPAEWWPIEQFMLKTCIHWAAARKEAKHYWDGVTVDHVPCCAPTRVVPSIPHSCHLIDDPPIINLGECVFLNLSFILRESAPTKTYETDFWRYLSPNLLEVFIPVLWVEWYHIITKMAVQVALRL